MGHCEVESQDPGSEAGGMLSRHFVADSFGCSSGSLKWVQMISKGKVEPTPLQKVLLMGQVPQLQQDLTAILLHAFAGAIDGLEGNEDWPRYRTL